MSQKRIVMTISQRNDGLEQTFHRNFHIQFPLWINIQKFSPPLQSRLSADNQKNTSNRVLLFYFPLINFTLLFILDQISLKTPAVPTKP